MRNSIRGEKAPRHRGASSTSCDDASLFARFGSVRGERFVGFEVHVALDGEAEWTAEVAQFVHAHESQFWRSHAEVAQAEGDVIESELGEEPGALRIRREELDDGFEVDVGLFVVHADDLRLAVSDELFGLCFGEECHVEVPCVGGTDRATLNTHKTC